MKLICTRENFKTAIFNSERVVAKQKTLPILNNILFQVKNKTIKLSATNLEIGISCEIRGKVEEEGEFTVQSRLLADYISLLPKDRVDLFAPKESKEGQDQILEVKCKNYSTKIKGQPATDFPLIPQIERTNRYLVKTEDFRRAVSQIIFAVSTSETRPEINGVSFNFSNGRLTMAATDSYRLAEKSVELDSKSSEVEKNIIVPVKTLQELLRILGGFKDPAAISDIDNIEISLSENQILFTLGNAELISRLVEGQYPDYRQIIPQQTKTKTVLDTNEFVKVTKTTSLFARSGIYDVNLEFSPDKKEVIVSSTNAQLGESVSRLSSDINGESNSIVVNYRYLLDGLQNIDSDQVEVDVIDGNNPCVLKPVSKKSDYLYIIMPIKQ